MAVKAEAAREARAKVTIYLYIYRELWLQRPRLPGRPELKELSIYLERAMAAET